MPAAAMRLPSGDIASAITGVGDACTLPRTSPAGDNEIQFAVGAAGDDLAVRARPPTAFKGDGSVTMFAAPPASGQRRKVAS